MHCKPQVPEQYKHRPYKPHPGHLRHYHRAEVDGEVIEGAILAPPEVLLADALPRAVLPATAAAAALLVPPGGIVVPRRAQLLPSQWGERGQGPPACLRRPRLLPVVSGMSPLLLSQGPTSPDGGVGPGGGGFARLLAVAACGGTGCGGLRVD